MSGQTVPAQKRRRGPKPTGKGVQIGVRLQPKDLGALDAYAASAEQKSRPEAIRAILADWLRTHGFLSVDAPKPSGPATDAVELMDKAIKKHRGSKTGTRSGVKLKKV